MSKKFMRTSEKGQSLQYLKPEIRDRKQRLQVMYSSHPPNSMVQEEENYKKNPMELDPENLNSITTPNDLRSYNKLSIQRPKNIHMSTLTKENFNLNSFQADNSMFLSSQQQKRDILHYRPKRVHRGLLEKCSMEFNEKQMIDSQIQTLKNQKVEKRDKKIINKSSSQPKFSFNFTHQHHKCRKHYQIKGMLKQNKSPQKWKSFQKNTSQNLIERSHQNKYSYEDLLKKIREYQEIIINVCGAYNQMKVYRYLQDKQIIKSKKQIEKLQKDNQNYKWIINEDLKIKMRSNNTHKDIQSDVNFNLNSIEMGKSYRSIYSNENITKPQTCMKNIQSLRDIKSHIIYGLHSFESETSKGIEQQKIEIITPQKGLRKISEEQVSLPKSTVLQHQLYKLKNPTLSDQISKDSQVIQLRENQSILLSKMRQKDMIIDEMMQLLDQKSKDLW